jgi:hypothetical protein
LLFGGGACYLLSVLWARNFEGLLRKCVASGPVMAARSGRRPVAWRRSVKGRRVRGRGRTDPARGRFRLGSSRLFMTALLPLTGCFAAPYAGGDAARRGISGENGV